MSLLAEAGERILLHPHDFAEDGRPGNYLSLREVYPRVYPTGSHIHYAALNQRDRGFLTHMLKDQNSTGDTRCFALGCWLSMSKVPVDDSRLEGRIDHRPQRDSIRSERQNQLTR